MAHKRLGFMQLAIICGFSLYYAYYLITFFGLFLSEPGDVGFELAHAGQLVFFAGSIATTVVLLGLFNRAGTVAIGHTRFLYLASLVPGLALPAVTAVGSELAWPPLPVFYAACLLSGASVAIGFMLWEDLATHGYLNRGVLAHGTIFCAGEVVFLLCSALLSRGQASVVAIVLLVASTALLAFIAPRCDTIQDLPVAPVKEYFRASWNLDIVVVVLNAAFGYAFILLYEQGAVPLLVSMAAAVLVDLAVAIAFGRGKWVMFTGSLRVCGAFVSCGLLMLACPNGTVRAVALGAIVLFWFLFRTMNGGSLTDLAHRNGFSTLYASTRGKLFANVGFAAGLAMGVAAHAFGTADIAWTFAPLALVGAFIIAALFLLPFDTESKAVGYRTLALVESHEAPDSSMSATCEEVTRRFKLSPRESEVLAYLVRGRNAKHIAEKLFISESTAKTHISNVYRKLGVHSQQELLDALEKL